MNRLELPQLSTDDSLVDLARQCVYRVLALALTDPESDRWRALGDQALQQAAIEAAQLLHESAADTQAELAPGELPPQRLDLEQVLARLNADDFDAAEEYQQTFGLLVSKKSPPYETEYCPHTLTIYRQQVIADIAGFYRAFGLEPSRDLPERHDHVALELEFMAWLIAKQEYARHAGRAEDAALCRDAQRQFLQDHLIWWAPAFAALLRIACDDRDGSSTFFGSVAAALSAMIHLERTRFGLAAPTELSRPRPTSDAADESASAAVAAADSVP